MSDRTRRRFLRPDEAEERTYTKDEIADACDWLRKLLKSGPLYQPDVMKNAEKCGVPPSLVRRAKHELDVVAVNMNDKNEHASWKVWFWKLPARSRGLLLDDDEQPRRKLTEPPPRDRYPNDKEYSRLFRQERYRHEPTKGRSQW